MSRQTFIFSDLVSAIQTIASHKQLNSHEENAISALNRAAQNFESLEKCCKENDRKSLTFVTKRFLETGNYNISGNHVYTGAVSMTSTVDIPSYASESDVSTVSDSVTTLSETVESSFSKINKYTSITVSSSKIVITLQNDITDLVNGVVNVNYNISDYTLNLQSITSLSNLSCRRFTIINEGKDGDMSNYASNFSVGYTPVTFAIELAFAGTPTSGKSNLQEIWIINENGNVKVFSTVTYFGVPV